MQFLHIGSKHVHDHNRTAVQGGNRDPLVITPTILAKTDAPIKRSLAAQRRAIRNG